jgi:small subunit ribosomal protein S6
MKKYEVMYILKANLEDAKRQEVMDGLHAIITSNNGTIENVDEWGLKEFAYEINKEKKGYYVVVKMTANNEGIKEFDRLARINNNVVRFLIVKEEA